MNLLLIIVLILVLFGGGGYYGYTGLGPAYGGGIGVVGLIIIVLLLVGVIRI